ncbi:MAG: hypothetical protein KF797_03550 [Flavobacteriales bacterium]|nr:hypothetical protein [Flavobacteriales bacterium]
MAGSGNSAQAKRMDLAFASLLSKDDEEALAAITRIGKEGDARAIRPLLAALANTGSAAVRQRITTMLFEVKAQKADEALLAALEDPELREVRSIALSTFWNAGIDVRDHLSTFVDIALNGTAAECLECLTVIENQEIWPEKEARLALKRVEKAAAAESDPYKGSILNSLVEALRYRLGVDEAG